MTIGGGTGSGAFTFNGPASGQLLLKGTTTSTDGIYINQIASIGTSGNVELEGVGTGGSTYGIYWSPTSGTNTLTASSGSLTLLGLAHSGGGGAYIANSVGLTNNGSGALTLDGTSDSGIGLQFPAGTITVNNTSTGTLTLAGNADTADIASPSGTGLKLSGGLVINFGPVTLTGLAGGSNTGVWLVGGSTITNNSTGLPTIAATHGDAFSAQITSTAGGDILISDNLTLTQYSGSSITGGSLELSGVGTFNLIRNNAVSMLAGSVGSVSFTNTQALTIGTVHGVSGLAATGSLVVDLTSGDLSVASGATVTGASPLLVTTTAFVNSQGSNAVTASSGSWQIFSANPTGDTFGSLNSNNVALWNTTYSGSANAATGNRYIFAFRPTVTFTPQSISKTYGVNDTAAVSSSYIVTGVQGAVTNAFWGDTAASAYSGSPSVTSTGSAATAGVGSYSVIATVGSLSAKDNHALGYGSAATLTVNAATLTVTGNALSRAYGSANPTLTYSTSGLVNGDTLSGTLATSAVATSGVGAYAITVLMNEGTARAAASRDSDDVLAIMLRTSWGHTAAEDASDLGVNPYAVAATCVLATGCSTPTEGAASQGVFQLNPAYFQQGLQTALTVAPALASQIVQGSDDTHDPTTEAIAAAGYLILVDRTLKNAGISHPTILQARGFFIFATASRALATAPPGATMAAAMPDVPQATLTANGITPGETVAQWEAFLTARISPAATQRLLIR